MPNKSTNLKRAQLADALRHFTSVANSLPPARGWVRAIRESLSMTQGQLASRLKVSRQSIQDFERAESERRITLDSLDRLAAGMGCRVVYALVPFDASLDAMRTQRAREQAEKLMGPVAHSMAMESQAVPSNVRERQIQVLMEDLLSGSARELWKEPTPRDEY
jgi:predicted DNA-binding mobile mystery protein A